MTRESRLETFIGHIETLDDALLLFNACSNKSLKTATRRLTPTDIAKIQSGSIFVWTKDSGISRWTDSKSWSPSRISNNFLVYKELDDDKPQYHSKKYEKKKKGTYSIKEGGMIKKTLSVWLEGVHFHLASYHTEEDVKNGRLERVSKTSISELAESLNSIKAKIELCLGNSNKPPSARASPVKSVNKKRKKRRVKDSEEEDELEDEEDEAIENSSTTSSNSKPSSTTSLSKPKRETPKREEKVKRVKYQECEEIDEDKEEEKIVNKIESKSFVEIRESLISDRIKQIQQTQKPNHASEASETDDDDLYVPPKKEEDERILKIQQPKYSDYYKNYKPADNIEPVQPLSKKRIQTEERIQKRKKKFEIFNSISTVWANLYSAVLKINSGEEEDLFDDDDDSDDEEVHLPSSCHIPFNPCPCLAVDKQNPHQYPTSSPSPLIFCNDEEEEEVKQPLSRRNSIGSDIILEVLHEKFDVSSSPATRALTMNLV